MCTLEINIEIQILKCFNLVYFHNITIFNGLGTLNYVQKSK